ncbi:MAG: hypothetical protein JW719_07675 [Pirellulales bacterium]|nr:hypothetical protein [Pirellulales bacterium]
MASNLSPNDGSSSGKPAGTGRQPLTQAQRKRFQQLFIHAGKQAATNNFDYATELFSQCVLGDKNNTAYWQSFLANLRKKYHENKKGAKLASIRTGTQRATVKKCQLRKDWNGVFKHGIEVLKLNPWDTSTLMAMAAAGEAIELDEVPLVFLHTAREAAPNDIDLNRAAGRALRIRRQHDQAIYCWQRVLEIKGEDEEAQRQISELRTEKVIHKGGYENAQSSLDVQAKTEDEPAQPVAEPIARHDLTPERKLEKAILADPADPAPYLELAELLCEKEAYDKADELLGRAYEATGQASDVLERWEDVQLRGLRKKLRELEKEHKKSGSPEIKQQWKEVRRQFDLKSLERTQHLAERYPNNLVYEFDLGEAHLRVGQCKEAIEHFQKARSDPRRKGECLLRLGQCFHHINQVRLASDSFEAALAEISGQNPDLLKEALYSAGRLSLETNHLDKAEKQLTELAGLDFGYRDVSALLDKVNELRNTE